ncbi:MAG TPA: PIN domain-containing protein [Leptospiraceae bacterium]|nr:PIN domain-containing protein [Leptospiraceae bacterium]HMW08012.1 PIN domain-containing protein [Leptospiraceae bacterium]HMX35623.1 PIN domain-containing protein [Leptospiraceae bacterium]HMY33768.1 PIN domain-containing protein [Leptospiraceae bacterium]HMZ64859.1 PIN domain-containing protein [Leptospiraceae bacterium]
MIKSLIDTGPIVAFFDESDSYCQDIRNFLKDFKGHFYTNLAITTEVCYLLSDSKKTRNSFLQWIKDGAITILAQENKDFILIQYFMEKYSDRPMDFADASLIVLSESHGIKDILTLDSDFLFYKNKKGKSLNILNKDMIR